ncbi:MAG: hypothetical protein MUC28_02935 [Planctomycetes bacterium]|nr:hypothetical protein [Planctomycetota bacterium]
MSNNTYKALAVLIGYVIGVGMFGMPFLISRAGVIPFFILVIGLGLVQHFLHLIYANVILVTKEYHQLPGYAGLYLGGSGKKLAALAKITGDFSALLAYIIITGIFLNELLSPYLGGNEFIYASLLFAFEALIIFFGIGMLARAELFMTILLLLVVILITAKGWGHINTDNFILIDWRYALLPYGAMLYALDGNGAIPMVVRILRRSKENIRRVIRLGFVIPVSVIIAFTLVVAGVTGAASTPDALTGLKASFNNGIILFSLVFGILCMVTSYLGVSESSQEALNRDFKLPKRLSWALVSFIPYGLYLIGFKNLIDIINFAGGVAGGTLAIVLILIFLKLRKKRGGLVIFKRKPSVVFTFFLIFLFICGIVYEIISFMS